MSSLEMDFDTQMVNLECEWRQVYEASISARVEYQRLAASKTATVELLDVAREKLDRAESMKARIMTKIDQLDYRILGHQ